MITVIGIPVYFHYCGGELEEVNYVMKSSSCCDGEEDDSAEEDNGCCKDENYILKSNTDFTLKDQNTFAFVKTFSQLFYITLPFSDLIQFHSLEEPSASYAETPPLLLQQNQIITTSILRI